MWLGGMGLDTVCEICENKHGNADIELVLDKLERQLKGIRTVKQPVPLPWSIKSTCPYGLNCQSLQEIDTRLEQRAHKFDGRLLRVARSKDEVLFLNISSTLRTWFPSVYCVLMEERKQQILQ